MNEKAIRRIRNKFIRIFMRAMSLVMFFFGVFTMSVYTISAQRQIYTVLTYISDNKGDIDRQNQKTTDRQEQDLNNFSSEFRYSVRYFAVEVDKNNDISRLALNHIAEVSKKEAKAITIKALKEDMFGFGRNGKYYYKITKMDNGSRLIVFLDCSNHLDTKHKLFYSLFMIFVIGLIFTYMLVRKMSRKMIAPEIENAKKQNLFITNASHELKTPLAVIRANTEVIEMMDGESEWTQSTMKQVDRMNGLIQNLVAIARAEEKDNQEELSVINVSKAVQETLDPFDSLAKQGEITFHKNIEENVTLRAEEAKIRQLTSLLIDNSFKYCDEKGQVIAELYTTKGTLGLGRLLHLDIRNSYQAGADVDYNKFFDRFYREDEAHSNQSGYGIGLSVAESIVKNYGGTIEVDWKDGIITFSCIFKLKSRDSDGGKK